MSSRGDFCSFLDSLAGRTIVRLTCDELCPQILSGLSVAERSLKMKSQTHLTISSASATALILLSFLSLGSAAPIPQLTLAPRTHDGSFQSTNWSGYAVTGPSGSVSDAKGSWTVPAIQGSCPSTNQYSSFWVGIDGLAPGLWNRQAQTPTARTAPPPTTHGTNSTHTPPSSSTASP